MKNKKESISNSQTDSSVNSTSNASASKLSVTTGQLSERWQALSTRDRLALSVLLVFLLGFGGIYGGYVLHNKVAKQQRIFDNKVAELFWLRSQADNLKPASSVAQGTNDQPLSTQITNVLGGLGINNPTVVQSADGVQLSFEHNSQATISRVIEELQRTLAPQGYGFSRLLVSQNEQLTMIRVQATVASN